MHYGSSSGRIAPQECVLVQQRDASGHTHAAAITSQSSVINEIAQRYVGKSPGSIVVG